MLTLHDVSRVGQSAASRSISGVECCLALWTASAPEPEPLSPAARRVLERLPDRRRRASEALDRTWPGWSLHAASWFYRAGNRGFDAALEHLRAESAARLACDLVAGELIGADRDPARRAAAQVEKERRMASMLRRADDVVAEMMEVIEAFWSAGFRALWAREQASLGALAERLTAHVRRDLVRTLVTLSPRAVYDRPRDRLTFLGGQRSWSLRCSELQGVDVLPSLWLRRRVVALYGSDRAGVCIAGLRTGVDRLPPDRLASLLATLAEPRRLEIVRLCTREPLCTQELSGRLGISEAPVSRHLKQLDAHGLVVGQRFGRQVTYTAVPETVALLGRALCTLAPSGAEGLPSIEGSPQ